ncbi:GRAM domain-containing protein 2B isoform X3 [Penaeus vannamei]|uniref:GRAM domain-containing protein 2B isoform X3 n=1 Tax=Penaeus vannamei TaxID=6689 RepID=UPI00387F736E
MVACCMARGHVSTAPSLENNMDKLGVEGASSRGGSFVSRTPSPSPSSRSRSRDRKNSAKHATGHLAAHAFNLMVTVPQHITKDALEDDGAPSMGKLTPDLLGGHHYEADVSDQSDSFLGLPPGPGTAKSAPSTPQTEQRIVPRPLPRHDTFIAPGVSPALPTSPNFRPMKLKTTSFSKTNRHALKNLSRSTPAMSPSASPRHSDSEGPPRVSKGTKKFMRHFADAPPSERVLNYFACALVSDILLQGTLYITPNFFAFYSKIFGHVSRLLIPVSQVASVQKERTAKIIPNAVGLHMVDGKSYVFGSLLSRDSTYKLMNHILKKAQQIGDSDSEPPSAVQVAVDDDGEDSVSASAESLMEEDQADGFLATSQVVDLVGVTATTTTPWIRDGCTATTTSSITSSSNTTATASTISTAGIPGHNLPGSPNCTTVLRRGSLSSPKAGTEEPGGAGGGAGGGVGVLFEWFTQGSLVKTCFKVGSIPVKLIGEGVKELWSLPRTSILLIISTLLLLLLFASAAFMLHRVDVLSQQLGLEKYDEYNGMYEEVLQMQQRLHAAASSEIEKTLSIQLKHIATVRQSLEALVVLFNKEPPVSTAQIPDNT